MGKRNLHGRIKRFWLFMVIASFVAFIANSSIQMLISGEVDMNSALTTSVSLGIVIALFMASQGKHKKEDQE